MIRTIENQIPLHPYQRFVYLAGGASQALRWLISVPRASSNVREAVVPYSMMSMIQLPGKIPYIATTKSNRSWPSVVTLSKGQRTREDEDEVSSQFLLMAIVNACRITTAFCADLTKFDMSNESEETFTEDEELEQLLNGDICFKIYIPQMQRERLNILSGSFNPLHEGHLKLLEVATTSICGNGSPCFELSAINVDKPPLSVQEIKNRVKQFEKFGKTVIISNQPFFYKKAKLLPASAFVISADTAVRLLDVLVDFDILDELKDMFISTPADTFCMDVSSTEIRSHGAQ